VSTNAPLSSSADTTARLPFSLASISEVRPNCAQSHKPRDGDESKHRHAYHTNHHPSPHAQGRAQPLTLSAASVDAPLSSSSDTIAKC
jgi:hypothetical protein